jgi:hypothetical protein
MKRRKMMKREQYEFLRKAAEVIMELDEPGKPKVSMDNLDLSIIKIDCNGNPIKLEHLFEGIPAYEEANLLAQFAMGEKDDNEIIAILPGRNRSIKKYYPTDYADALVLAQKYKYVKIGGNKNEHE